MLSVGWLLLAVFVAMLLTAWVTFTLTRLDRLHARVDAAQASLDAQLVRRAAALQDVAQHADSGVPEALRAHYDAVAHTALQHGLHPGGFDGSGGPDRADSRANERRNAENAVGRAVAELADPPVTLRPDGVAELQEAAARVLVARRFYNDAVRDTRDLRRRRLPRLLHLAGRRELPTFFDIDDTLPTPPAGPVRDAAGDAAGDAADRRA